MNCKNIALKHVAYNSDLLLCRRNSTIIPDWYVALYTSLFAQHVSVVSPLSIYFQSVTPYIYILRFIKISAIPYYSARIPIPLILITRKSIFTYIYMYKRILFIYLLQTNIPSLSLKTFIFKNLQLTFTLKIKGEFILWMLKRSFYRIVGSFFLKKKKKKSWI